MCTIKLVLATIKVRHGAGLIVRDSVFSLSLFRNGFVIAFEPPRRSPCITLASTTPAGMAPQSCNEKCKTAGFCCQGLVSSHDNPSCAMGCELMVGTVEDCLADCARATTARCSITIRGNTLKMCFSCPGDCDASHKLQCEAGCRFAAGATVAPIPEPTPFPTHQPRWLEEHPVERVHCNTTKGEVDIDVHPEWAPIGAAHFLDLVRERYWDDVGFTRVNGDIVQFGEKQHPLVGAARRRLTDDPKPRHQVENKLSLRRGELSYAGGGPNTRGSSIFFVTKANKYLGRAPWEVPFAEVVPPGMDVVDKFYAGYGDTIRGCRTCNGPDVQRVFREGSGYLRSEFPELDFMVSCVVVPRDASEAHRFQLPSSSSASDAGTLSGEEPTSVNGFADSEDGVAASKLASSLAGGPPDMKQLAQDIDTRGWSTVAGVASGWAVISMILALILARRLCCRDCTRRPFR